MSETEKEFLPDAPPGGFVEDPDFVFLDEEERELIDWVQSVEWRPIENQEAAKRYFQEVARRTMEKRGIPESDVSDTSDVAPHVAD